VKKDLEENEMSKIRMKLKSHLTSESNKNIQENIVCSPELMQYIDDEKEESEIKTKPTNGSSQHSNDDNAELYELISQNYPDALCDDTRVDSDDMNGMDVDQKSSIGGLFLRNPRGIQS
jgi:hypothetical protein